MEAAPTEIIRVDAPPAKPGARTSEFWLTILTQVAAYTAVVADALPAKWGAIVGTVSTGVYAVVRLFQKRPPRPVLRLVK